ncbi:MAG: BMC domain-containing protein [Clostridiales bacterium]|nr:BMC domain-containing protein [Clostridiales bacterium]
MRKAVGFVEIKSIPVGIQTADEMVKAGNVELLLATPICPGKYVIIIGGKIGPVKAAMSKAELVSGIYLIDTHILDNIREEVLPAISGFTNTENIQAVGAIETISALTAIIAADTAVKAAKVSIVDLRIARGLGGKGYLIVTGEVSSVRSAVNSCLAQLSVSGEVTSTAIIPRPHPQIVENLLK